MRYTIKPRAYALNSTGIIGTTLVLDKCTRPKISSAGWNPPIFTEESHVPVTLFYQDLFPQVTRSPRCGTQEASTFGSHRHRHLRHHLRLQRLARDRHLCPRPSGLA